MKLLNNLLIKNEIKIFYFFIFLSTYNAFSHFIRKNIFGDRIDFWDFHVYWCTAKEFLNGNNPYGGKIIKDCLSQFNFDLYFSYPPIILKSLLFLGYFDLKVAKIIWILIVILSFFIIINYLKKIFINKDTSLFFFILLILFSFGGLIWSALLAGNISIILYAILITGLFQLYKKKITNYNFSIFIISLFKFPFIIFFLFPSFLYGYKEIKKIFFFLILTITVYYLQFIFDKDLFISFLDATKSYRGENFLLIHGTGIGIHGIIDSFQSLIFNNTQIKYFNPSGTFSLLIHLFVSTILILSSFFLFCKNKKKKDFQIKLLICFFTIIFICCLPRISSYDFFLVIPSLYYMYKYSRIRHISYFWKLVSILIILSTVSIYDSKIPSLILSITIFIFFYLQIKKKDPFYLKIKKKI